MTVTSNSLTAKSCYGREKHLNPVGFYSRNSTESTLHHKHNNQKHHHHGGAVCPSFGVGSVDPPNQTHVTSSEGVGRGGGGSDITKSINCQRINSFISYSIIYDVRRRLRRPCRRGDTEQGTSPNGAYQWLHTKPLYATIGRVLAPYRPGERHGHRC